MASKKKDLTIDASDISIGTIQMDAASTLRINPPGLEFEIDFGDGYKIVADKKKKRISFFVEGKETFWAGPGKLDREERAETRKKKLREKGLDQANTKAAKAERKERYSGI